MPIDHSENLKTRRNSLSPLKNVKKIEPKKGFLTE